MFRSSVVARFLPTLALFNAGTVVTWRGPQGYGFVEDDGDKKQHFVHFSDVQTETGGFRALTVGQKVEFEVATADGRTRAVNVTGPDGAKLPSGPRPNNQGRGFGGGRGGNRGGNRNRDGNFNRDRDNNRDGNFNRNRDNNRGQDGNNNTNNFSDDF